MRTVIVSGGGTGIGRATARAFARAGEKLLPQLPSEIDVLVNNAGGAPARRDASLAGIEAYLRAAFDANFMSAALLTEALVGRLRRPGGRIVSVSSIHALRGGGAPLR